MRFIVPVLRDVFDTKAVQLGVRDQFDGRSLALVVFDRVDRSTRNENRTSFLA